MRIINASVESPTPAEGLPVSQAKLDWLTRHHPVTTLFTVRLLQAASGTTALKLHWRQPHPEAKGLARAALGCVVDYIARLTAYPFIGHCDLSESELRCYTPFDANALLATAYLSATERECATYHCEIYALERGREVPVADSQGTLLRRP